MTFLSLSIIAHVFLIVLYSGLLIIALNKKSKTGILFALSLIVLDSIWNVSVGGMENIDIVGKNLLAIGFMTTFFIWCKEYFVKFIVILFGIIGLSGIHQVEFQKFVDGKKSEENAQLLVQFKTKADLEQWMITYEYPESITYPAFEPADDSFLLDEYLILDYSGRDISGFMTVLESSNIIDHVEINETITVTPLVSSPTINASTQKSKLNDPYVSKQRMKGPYDLDNFHKLTDKYSSTNKKKPIIIAILDTGVDSKHEDLKANYLSTSSNSDYDKKGHGTHCAGIAAAVTGNRIGIASLVPKDADIKVTGIKVLGDMGVGTQKTIIRGIIMAADRGYDIISMSLGSVSSDKKQKAYNEAIKYARSKGCIVVAAAGNSARDATNYSPANSKGLIAVSAVDSLLRKANFANDISNIEYGIYAPGTMVFSTFPGDEYKSFNGTSMATPLVAGLLAVMKSYKRNLTTEEAFEYINKTAYKKQGINILDPISTMTLFLSSINEDGIESPVEWSPSHWMYQ